MREEFWAITDIEEFLQKYGDCFCETNFLFSFEERGKRVDSLIDENCGKAAEIILQQFDAIIQQYNNHTDLDITYFYQQINSFSGFGFVTNCKLFLRFYFMIKMLSCLDKESLWGIFKQLKEKAQTLISKRLLLYVLTLAPELTPEEKLNSFLKWKENPVFEIYNNLKNSLDKNKIEWFKKGHSLIGDCKYDKEREKYLVYVDLYNFLYYFHASLQGNERMKNEIKKIDIFTDMERIVNELNSKIYKDAFRNKNSREKLKDAYFMEKICSSWNKIIPNICKIEKDRNKQKNLEMWVLLRFLEKSNIKPRDLTVPPQQEEPPDFTLITRDGKKIAIELVTYDPEEYMKEPYSPENNYYIEFDFSMSSVQNHIQRRIEEKERKMEKAKIEGRLEGYNEKWLIIHLGGSMKGLDDLITLNHISQHLPNVVQALKACKFFDKIYLTIADKVVPLPCRE